jgi:hypothetical protein
MFTRDKSLPIESCNAARTLQNHKQDSFVL